MADHIYEALIDSGGAFLLGGKTLNDINDAVSKWPQSSPPAADSSSR